MIFTLILKVFVDVLGVIFYLIPVVVLPAGVASAFVLMVSYYNAFLSIFPFAVLPTTIFLTIILPFEITLLIAKFFLGHRLPVQIN